MSRVSVIIPFHNDGEYLNGSIQSIIEQNYSFDDISIYLIDDGSTNDSRKTGESFAYVYPNITYIRQEHKGISAARNKGIELSLEEDSEFTFFLDVDDKYENNHINKCIEILQKYPESVFACGIIEFFEAQKGLDSRFSLARYVRTREIEISDNVTDALYAGHVGQGGWRTADLANYRFNEAFSYCEDIDFMSRILSDNKFVFLKDIKYMLRKRFSENSVVNVGPDNIEWYEKVWNVFVPLYTDMINKNEFVPFFIQQMVIENICALFLDSKSNKIFSQIDYEKMEKALHFIMKNTDESILTCKLIPHWQRMYFYTFKYGEPNLTRWAPIPTFVMNNTGASDEGERFGYLGSDPLVMHIMNEKQGQLIIRVSMRCLTYNHFDLEINSDYYTEFFEVPAPFERDKMFFCGKEIFPRKYYEIKINLKKPLKPIKKPESGLIRFYLKTEYGDLVSVKFDALPHSGIGYNMPFTLGDEFIIKRTKHTNVLKVSPFTEKELLTTCTEIKPYSGIGASHPESVKKFEDLKTSIIENFRNFSGRRIWLFIDRGYDIGNNAEALFRHCAHKDDGILKYYVIPDESYAQRFAGLPYMILGSLEYKLLCCFAEKFISPYLFGGGLTLKFGVEREEKELWEDIRNFKKLARAFFRGDIIHIQHGVIMQDISYYISKFDEETRVLLSVSQKEYDYLKRDLGHAINEDILRLTGLPRNDYLEKAKNNPNSQKVILFAPSFDWKYFQEGKYIPEYKHSKHYKYLSSVFNSSELLDMLEENGYTLYFKPHYLIIPQLGDFEFDQRVKVVQNEIDRYELYAMCDLMISDYSGIAFDFAYLKKPVIYSHFMDNPKFDETYFSYENNGFGEICKNIETLIKAIADYVESGCKMTEMYQKRVDDFFSIQDDQNCERIYQELLKLPDTRKNIF